jgi:hypothetical protein
MALRSSSKNWPEKMLRKALLSFGVLLTFGGLISSISGWQGALVMTFWGLVLVAAVVFERWRYRKTPGAAESDWQETEERFVDPETGVLTQVMYDPRTGDRRYRPVAGDEKSP